MTEKEKNQIIEIADALVRVWFELRENDSSSAKKVDKAIDLLYEITRD